jgi:hypothetical protein
VKAKAIQEIIGACGTTHKSFRKYLSSISGQNAVEKLQQKVILGTVHVLWKVLM